MSSEGAYLGFLRLLGSLAFFVGVCLLVVGLAFGDDDDSVGILFFGGSVFVFGFGTYLGGVEGGWRSTAASTMICSVAAAAVLLNLGVPAFVVGGAGALFATGWSVIHIRSGRQSALPIVVGVGWASAVVTLALAAAAPPPYFHDPFVEGFETAFAEAGMPVLARGEHAFSIVGRGSYTDQVTVLLIDMSGPCPDGSRSCVTEHFDQTAWVASVEESGPSPGFDVEVEAERGSCWMTVGRPAEAPPYQADEVGAVDESNPTRWLAVAGCSRRRA